jgi:hypothetical protein
MRVQIRDQEVKAELSIVPHEVIREADEVIECRFDIIYLSLLVVKVQGLSRTCHGPGSTLGIPHWRSVARGLMFRQLAKDGAIQPKLSSLSSGISFSLVADAGSGFFSGCRDLKLSIVPRSLGCISSLHSLA